MSQSIAYAIQRIISPDPAAKSRRERRLRMAVIAIAAGIAIGCAVFPEAGWDWYAYHYRMAFNPTASVYPAWLYLILSPVARLPFSFAFFTALSASLIILALLLVRRAHPLLVLTLPLWWIFFYGQMDAFLVIGAVGGLWALRRQRPVLLGLAVFSLLLKLHVGVLLALFFLIRARSYKTMIIPAAAGVLSLLLYGFWPVNLVQNLVAFPKLELVAQQVNTSLWPWSLLAIPPVLLRWKHLDDEQRAAVLMATGALLSPYSPVYSLITLTFLTTATPWISLALLPAWLGPQAAGISGSVFAVLTLLMYLFPPQERRKLITRFKEAIRPRKPHATAPLPAPIDGEGREYS